MGDEYGKDPNNVYIYLMSDLLQGVGQVKDNVTCAFTKSSLDLKIHGHKGKSYRLVITNLDKEIDPEKSKAVVKKNRITITMRKVKGQYGYDSWIDLKAKRPNAQAKDKDPSDSIMDMMKQMYDEGDDTMKKTLGEAMLKSRQDQMRGKSSINNDL